MNPNKLPWLHYQDIQVPDIEIQKAFNSYINTGNYVEAIKLLRTNKEQLQGKAFISETITKIINGLLALEDAFSTNVPMFLSSLGKRYQDLIDNFKNASNWSPSLQYTPYNFVFYNKEVYLSIAESPIGTLPTNITYWLKLGMIGIKGTPGIDVNLRYQWKEGSDYEARDLVAYNSNLYMATRPNINVNPETDPVTWTPFILTSKGKLNVGVTPPGSPVENMIWFETKEDPLTATGTIFGHMRRYRKTGEWEPMHPTTFFTLVNGREVYAPKAIIKKVTFLPELWALVKNQYEVVYNNFNILDSSLVEIAPANEMSPEEFQLYSKLKVEVIPGQIKFILPVKPIEPFIIEVKIQ